MQKTALFPIGPNKKISVLPVKGLKILGRVGTKNNIILCFLKGKMPFKMHNFFSENLKKFRFHH